MPAPGTRLQTQLVGTVILLLLFGQIMLFSATGVLGIQRHGSEFYYVIRQGLCGIVGLSLIYLVSRIRFQWWKQLAYPIFIFQIILVSLTLFSGLSHSAQGASRWLKIGDFILQPSELAKVSLSIFLANILELDEKKNQSIGIHINSAIIILLLLFLVFRQPDLGTTALLATVVLGMLFIAGVRMLYIFFGLGVGAIGFIVFAIHSDYRRKRILAFLNPWADPQGSGFQAIQSFLSFYSGKIFGTGIGNGNSKLFFLPEVHTDFIYALVGEELGFIGSIFLLSLFIYFSYLLFKVVIKAPTPFARYLAFGISLSLTLQIAVNLGAVTGILPVKGLPLPFISWGRSALLSHCVMIGILLNILRQSGTIRLSK